MTSDQIGLYFLGDDGVYDWAVGLLSSLRAVSPTVRIYCVPFSERVERLGRLETTYDFRMLHDPSLAELDDIGRELLGSMASPPEPWFAAIFRKFYTFWGPLKRFLYTDADVIMLDGFTELFELATTSEPLLMYAHHDIEQVYLPGQLRDRMVRDYATRAINAGLWASRAGVFTLQRLRELAVEARPFAHEFSRNADQAFLNYCLDVERVTMRPFGPVAECGWAGDPRPLRTDSASDGRLQVRWPDGSLVPAIHWAGYELSTRMPHYRIHRHFRVAAMSYGERMQLFWRELSDTRSSALLRRVWRRPG